MCMAWYNKSHFNFFAGIEDVEDSSTCCVGGTVLWSEYE